MHEIPTDDDTQYLLVMALRRDGLPVPIGTLVATGPPSAVSGESAVGEGKNVNPFEIQAAIDLLRGLPPAGGASASEWLRGLSGLTNGTVCFAGPFTWQAEAREVLHWSIKQMKLRIRGVAQVRDGEVIDTSEE